MTDMYKICIFNPVPVRFDETYLDRALGGSETWTIQLSDAFSKLGNEVWVINNCEISHTSRTGVNYISFSDLNRLAGMKFDFIITSRMCRDCFRVFSYFKCSDCIFLHLHDPHPLDITDDIKADPRLRQVVCLTKWHKHNVVENDGISENNVSIIPNGIDPILFDGMDVVKDHDNSILWSSCFDRGLKILVEDVAPIVRYKIPEFKVYCASYSQNSDEIANGLGNIEYLHGLSKKDLYKEMYKHAVWFFPSINDETFCITAIENMMAGNNVVMFPQYGTTEYTDLIDPLSMSFSSDSTYELACEEAAERIVGYIYNFNSEEQINMRKKAKGFVLENFTWDVTARKYIELFDRVR